MTAPVVCRLDLAPAVATLTTPDGAPQQFNRARVIVTDERVYVFVDGNRTPVEAYSARIESVEGRNTIGYRVVTAGGDTVDFKRGGGCMCGSQLKAFRPFPEGLVQGTYAYQ